jgi:hypothetical protein
MLPGSDKNGARHQLRVRPPQHRTTTHTAIIDHNQRHFSQAQGIPFTQPPLKHITSDTGFNVYTDADDNDIVLPDTAFVKTAKVLGILRERSKNPITQWSPDLDFEDFIPGLLHWKEETPTTSSFRYLGLYKVLTTAYCNNSGEFSKPFKDDDPSDPPTNEKAEQVLQVMYMGLQRRQQPTVSTCDGGCKSSI